MSAVAEVLLNSVLSVAVLFIISRALGYRQLSQLSIFDYITSITIGNLGGEFALSRGEDTLPAFISILIFGAFGIGLAFITDKSIKARHLLNGKPIVLASNGRIFRDSFKKARLDIEEFEAECRAQGYFDISQIHTALMEHNGKLSILPKAAYKNATAADVNAELSEQGLSANLILDGVIIRQNLEKIGKDEQWLMDCLSARGIADVKDVFIAVYNANAQLSIFAKLCCKIDKSVL